MHHMHIRNFLLVGALCAPSVSHAIIASGALPSSPGARSAPEFTLRRTPPAAWDETDPADSLYRKAREALNDKDFRRAANMFRDLAAKFPKSTYAPDALYWRAFALYSIGSEADLRDALGALSTQRSRYPKAATVGESGTLAVRIRGALARHGDVGAAEAISSVATRQSPCPRGEIKDDDSDMRMAAMNALLQMDSEQALPILKEVLQKRDACSAPLRRKAMFLLSQKSSPESERLLIDAVSSDPDHEVREQAVFWLGQVHSDRATTTLEQLATSSPDMAIREKAVFALEQQHSPRSGAFIRRLAESPGTPVALRKRAIFSLEQDPSAENATFLKALFSRAANGEREDDFRKHILFSLSQMREQGNEKWLMTVAQDESQSLDVRKHALFCAGQAGASGSDLVALYDKLANPDLKEHMIWVLSESRDKAAGDKLVEIAKHDRNSDMRKKAIFWLSQKNDPRARQILLDIIKG